MIRYWCLSIPILMCVATSGCKRGDRPVVFDPNGPDLSAADLFRAFEEKVVSAKVVRVASVWQNEGGKSEATFKIDFLLGPDKARISSTTNVRGVDRVLTFASDGENVRRSVDQGVTFKETGLPKDLGRTLRYNFTRLGGMVTAISAMQENFGGEETAAIGLLPFRDVTFLPDETSRGRRVRVLQYDLRGKKSGIKISLWLDSETLRPLKRVTRVDSGAVSTETYDGFELDGVAEDAEFRLSK